MNAMLDTNDDNGNSLWGMYKAPTAATAAPAMTATAASPHASVSDWYHQYLGRDADAGGLAYWQHDLDAGMSYDDVLNGFKAGASQEMAGRSTSGGLGGLMTGAATGAATTPNTGTLTPYQQWAQDEVTKYQGKPLSDYDIYGAQNAQTAQFLDRDVAAFYQDWDGNTGAPSINQMPSDIRAKAQNMMDLYNNQGWNAVLQYAKDKDIQTSQGAVYSATLNPNKQLSTGAWTWKDTLGALGALALPIGGMLLAPAAGGLGAGTAAAGTAAGTGLGAVGSSGLGAATAAGAGTSAIAAGIPTISVVGAAGGGGLGALGTAGAIGAGVAGAAGLNSVLTGGSGVPNTAVDPNIPTVNVVGNAPVGLSGPGAVAGTAGTLLGLDQVTKPTTNIPTDLPQSTEGGTHIPESALIPAVFPPLNTTVPESAFEPTPAATGLGGNTTIPSTNTGGSTPSLPSIPGLGSIPGAVGTIGGIINDYLNNKKDGDYWQNYMDQMLGMYKPGTPEAEMMRKKLEAKDAAAGRNSQYGIREQNLAALLAEQRAKIMTSDAFYKMGSASRGHYTNELNSLFSALGSGGVTGGLTSLLNAGTGIYNAGSSLYDTLFGNATSAPVR